MKKRLILLAIFVAHTVLIPLFAQNNLEYQDVYRDYIAPQNISNILAKFSVGDTLLISSIHCKAEYVLPDTIWKKRVKNPKEGKHYILQYIWNGVPTAKKTKTGFPLYEQSTFNVDGMYIYKGFDYSNTNNSWIIVNDPTLSRDIKFSTESLYIKSPKLINEINKRMTADSIYYVLDKGNKEEDYGVLKVQSIDYTIEINNARCSGDVDVYVPRIIIGFKNGKLEIFNRRIISKQEYDAFWGKINKDRNFLSLVVIKDAIPDGKEYYFKSDTMALYKMEKSKENEWSDDSYMIYYCYAYGQSYTFGKEYNSRNDIDNYVNMLSPEDSTYLLNRKSNGENYRLENAKKWDEKNIWLVERDEKWDEDTCVFATIKWSDGIQLIDKEGKHKYDFLAERPKKGTIVPVVCYGHDGDYLASYRVYYKGEFYAIDRRGLDFKSTDEYTYLMRRGQQGYSKRIIAALAYELVEALVEESKKYENFDKKQIFYLGNKTYDSGYGWDGVEIKFYKPYKKTIKYIYCTLTAYNYFGDAQADCYGRCTKDVRCIGPIEHGEESSFSFDDVMNNKNEIIQFYRPTKITITFVDNSTMSFTGWAKIKPHSDK